MYMYIHIHIHIYTCMYIYIYTYIYNMRTHAHSGSKYAARFLMVGTLSAATSFPCHRRTRTGPGRPPPGNAPKSISRALQGVAQTARQFKIA